MITLNVAQCPSIPMLTILKRTSQFSCYSRPNIGYPLHAFTPTQNLPRYVSRQDSNKLSGGANGTRTRNPLLAKQVRYQLRHSPVGDPQSSAVSVTDVHRSALSERSTRTCRTTMPTATTDPTATQHVTHFFMISSAQTRLRMVGLGGLEPPTSVLSGLRSNLLSYRPNRHPCGHSDIVHRIGPSSKIETW